MSILVGLLLSAIAVGGYLVLVLTIPGLLTRWVEALLRRDDTQWEPTVVPLRPGFGEDQPRLWNEPADGAVPCSEDATPVPLTRVTR